MKKIIQTVADGGGELGVHMYPLRTLQWSRVTTWLGIENIIMRYENRNHVLLIITRRQNQRQLENKIFRSYLLIQASLQYQAWMEFEPMTSAISPRASHGTTLICVVVRLMVENEFYPPPIKKDFCNFQNFWNLKSSCGIIFLDVFF